MSTNDMYKRLTQYIGEPVRNLDVNCYIHGCLTGGMRKAYYKLEAREPYIAVSVKASSPGLSVKMLDARICEEIEAYGESKTQTDDILFPEFFKRFDAEKHSTTGYVSTYLFPVTVSGIYLLSMSLESLTSDECLFVFKAYYPYQ